MVILGSYWGVRDELYRCAAPVNCRDRVAFGGKSIRYCQQLAGNTTDGKGTDHAMESRRWGTT